MTLLRSLVKISISSFGIYNLSNEWISDLATPYLGYILDTPEINERMDTNYGGQFAMKVGRIGISQKFFSGIGAWPPPEAIGIAWYTTLSTEAAKELQFIATGIKPSGAIDGNGQLVYYDLKKQSFSAQVLDIGYGYDDVAAFDVVDTASYAWTISGAGPEYILTTTPADWPGTKPDRVEINQVLAVEGTVGTLAVNEWGWSGAQLYARVVADLDPDVLPTGYIRADFGTTETPMPRAFGPVQFRAPERLPNRTIGGSVYACYDLAHIAGTKASSFTAVSDNGGGFCRFASTGHGFTNGWVITTEVEPNHAYNDTSAILWIDANTYDKVTLPFAATEVGHAYQPLPVATWRAYDAGIPTTATTIIQHDEFRVTPAPTGEFTVSGVGYDDTPAAIADQDDVAAWVQTKLSISALDITVAEASSPPIAHWETEQDTLTGWFSGVTAYYKHMFYIDGITLYLIDLEQDNGTRTVTEFQVRLGVKHGVENKPTSLVNASWVVRDWVEAQGTFGVNDFQRDASVPVSLQSFATPITVKAFHTDRTEVEARLALIGAILERENVVFTLGKVAWESAFAPDPGSRWGFTNTYNASDLTVLARLVQRQYRLDLETVRIQVKSTT